MISHHELEVLLDWHDASKPECRGTMNPTAGGLCQLGDRAGTVLFECDRCGVMYALDVKSRRVVSWYFRPDELQLRRVAAQALRWFGWHVRE